MKYFDSDFFKFTFGFLAIVSVALLVILGAALFAGGDNQVAEPAANVQN